MRWYDAPPKSAKRSTFSHKMGVRFKKVHLFWGPAPPKSILTTGLEKSFLFRQSGSGGHLDVMVYTWTSLIKLITKHVLSFHAKNKTKNKNTTPVNEGVFIPNFTPK